MKVSVYSKQACVQCTATKKVMNRIGIQFEEVRVDQDPAALEYVKGLGHLSAPVVVVTNADGEVLIHWGGFIPEKIENLFKLVA